MKKIIILSSVLLFALFQSVQAQVNLNTGLLAHLPMNGNGNDVSGNSNNASVSSVGVYASPNLCNTANQSLLFNRIESGNMEFSSPLFNNRTEFSMSFWFNPASLTNTMSLVGQDNILETGYYTSPTRIIVYHPTSGSVTVNLNQGINIWHHFAITCSATQMKIYLNGLLVETRSGNYSFGNNTTNTKIGGNVVNQNNNSWFDGSIDEVRFYTRVLNEDEITVLSGSGSLTYSLGTLSNLTYCVGASFQIPLTVMASNIQADNVFTLQLSDKSGSFSSPINIATINGINGGTFNAVIPNNIESGTGYKLRTVSSQPLFVGTQSSQTLTINNPSESFSTLSKGRILWYKFNANAADSSGNALDATLNGGTSYVADRFNNSTGALQLNGTNGYAAAPGGVYFNGPYTVSAWVNPQTFNNWSRVFDFARGSANDNILGAITKQTTGKPAAENYNGTTTGQVNSNFTLNLNAWNHLVFRWTGTLLQIYLNGNLVASGTSNNPRLVFRNLCYIGRSNWAADAFANAAFDDFMIYNRAITDDEILTLANDGIIYYNQSPCLGSALQLSAPFINGATYQWTGPNGFSSTQRQNIINNTTAANSGNYTLTITMGNCASYTQSHQITIISPSSQPTVSFTGLPDVTNTGVPPITLTGTPTNGFFYGAGVEDIDKFNPSIAGVGTHIIYYQVLNSEGCFTTVSDTVVVEESYNISNSTITACGGGFYDSGGAGASYAANESFVQTFCTGNSNRFQFYFSSFNLGSGDTLFVYDGNSTNDYLIGYYKSGSGADYIWSSGSCITFKFKSDASTQGTGWVSTFQCMADPTIQNEVEKMTAGMHQVCGITLYDPSGTSNYTQGTWTHTYRAAAGQRLQFEYITFAINGNNGGHWLRIYDGPTTAYPMIGQYNNFNFIPAVIQSSGEYLTFVFDASNNQAGYGGNSGFVGTLTCFGTALTEYNMSGGVISTCSGAFYDDGGPNMNFTANQYRKQTFCSDNGQHIQFRFNKNVTLADAGDTLWVYDGADTLGVLLGYYIDGSYIDRLTSSGTCLTFRFKSNSTTKAGWQGFIKCVPDMPIRDTINITSGMRATCNAFIADGSGGYAYGIGYNQQTYRSMNGERLKFEYTLFSINGNNGGHWLRIYDGPNTNYPLIGKYNNFNFIPPSIESTGEYLTFVFDRNNTQAGVGSAQGYEGILSCTSPSLPIYPISNATLYVCEGVFYDDGGPNVNYSDSKDYTQTFCSANNQMLRITFNKNETSFAAGDTLWAYDGPNTSSLPLGIYFAGSIIEPLTSSGTCLTFRYKSNSSSNARGWQGYISCISTPPSPNTYVMSSGTRYVCNGTLLDPGGTGNYPVGAGNTYVQTFTSYSGEHLRALVNSLSINGNNGGHWLRVYDGPSTASPLIGSYNNFNGGWAQGFQSTGSSLTFKFESTNTSAGSGSGFSISFNCFTGSPIDVDWLSSPICRGASMDINYTVNATVNSGNNYTVQLSDVSGSFSNPTTIGTLSSTDLSGTINVTIPIGADPGNGYRIRVNSSQPVQLGSPSPNPLSVIATPTQPGTINVNGSTTFCSGTGSATLNITNQSGMSYQWLKNDTVYVGTNSNTIVVTQPGVYKVAVFNSCDSLVSNSSVSITSIDSPTAPVITANGPTTVCNGQSVQLSVPTQAGVSYQWKNGNTNVGTNTNTYTATTAGIYTVTLTNSCGSALSINNIEIIISGNPPTVPVITANQTTICSGASTTLSVPSQTGADYQWQLNGNNVGTNTNTFTASQAGVYTLVISNSCGTVQSSNSITIDVINAPTIPTITAAGPTTFCQGQSVILSIPTQSGVSYQWQLNGNNVGTNTNTYTATQAGTYSVVVSNNCGNTNADNTINVVISGVAPTAPTITAVGSLTFCAGDSVELAITSQTGVTYQWKHNGTNIGTNSNTYIATQSGNYMVEVSNSCGAVSSTNSVDVNINPLPATPVISASGNTNICAGQSVTISSNQSADSYLWSNNEVTPTISVSSTGTYSLIVTDANGCTSNASNSITVNVTPLPSVPVLISATNTICSNSSAQITVNSNYTVNWYSTAVGGTSIGSGLTFNTPVLNTSSTFYAESSNNGCSSSTRLQVNIVVNENPNIMVDSIVDAGCNNATNGAIYISVNSGLSPYTFNWNNGEQTQNINNLPSGIYSVTVADANGCSTVQSNINVSSGAAITASIQSNNNILCHGDSTGSVEVVVTGGTPPYSYTWSNGQSGAEIDSLPAGNYSVTITDNNNCVSIQGPFNLSEPDALQLTFNVTDQTAIDFGEIDLTVNGGTAPYTYFWSNTEITQDITGLIAGTYFVTVTDDNNCTLTDSAVVTLVTSLTALQNHKIGVYPNPVVHSLMVELPTSHTYFISIYDVHGNLMFSQQSAFGKVIIDLEHYPSAAYLLQITSNDNKQSEYRKIIKN